ncbi:probable C-mannosyltransferase DPY19L1 [Leguminivora glycinivorella]|uniref:probable C-mannosyltransferase DPY19L1 n=1 Tax=Leguminivora glycinivorella TaxID=1035111 RepID=UPI00200F05BA|nr:probable C-mannosyltransferase DPY19L1 [Leguminivora glycinivorella]
MEKEVTTKAESVKKPARFSVEKIVRYTLVSLIALSLGYLHYLYVSTLFENDRNFSHLSTMEREISLRTEMGFYYSYYKTIVEERPFIAGVSKLMYDRLVEYPKEVNAFNRFNIAPEVLIGAMYRYLEPWLNTSTYRQCHTVYRGDDVDPVQSCVGLGEPMLFYLEAVWYLAGFLVVALFFSAYSLSNSVLGGLLAVAQYFANHAECTRVQWAPNERENMAAPLLILQMGLVVTQLRNGRTNCRLQVSVFIVNCLCLLFWQFTQFIFLTQTAIFFLMEQLKIIDLKSLCIFLHSHFCGLHMAVLLLQGNDMLKTSLYTSFFLVVSTYCLFFSTFRIKVQNKLDLFVESWLVVLRLLIVVTSSFYLKHLLCDFLEIEDDTHIWDILYSKFTNYKNFHTLMYTCSEAFDFLPFSTIVSYTKTCLIPMVVFGVGVTAYSWFKEEKKMVKKEVLEDEDSGIENNADSKEKTEVELDPTDPTIRYLRRLKIEPAAVYSVAQLCVSAVLAGLVMRLKLLFGSQLCLVSALAVSASHKVPPSFQKYLPLCWVAGIAALTHRLIVNMSVEMSHIGEFSDFQQEELLTWISKETGTKAAFAGSMPILATVMLVTRRPVVAHPHYENKEARARAYSVYKTYGKFTTEELYKELTALKAIYLIVENKYCYGRSRKGCSFEDIWNSEYPGRRGPRACHELLSGTVDHFYPVFRNNHYAVFRLHDYSVRYMPRSFDT